MSRKYRLTVALLIICLCVTMVPGRVYAQEADEVSLASEADETPSASGADEAKEGSGSAEEEIISEDEDDPGQGRLTGDVPKEFFDENGRMQAMATGIRHNSRFAGYDIIEGIDVSKWNKDIDWTSVKNAGIDFAFVRTSYRGYEKGGLAADSYAPANMRNAAAAGVKVGAYIFSHIRLCFPGIP